VTLADSFTLLERRVLDAICEKYPVDRSALRAQLSTAAFVRRENTGCGFFTYFVVDRSSGPPISGERLRDGPAARIEGVKHGFGFILWLDEGYGSCLEGYNWGEGNTAGLDLETVRFEIAAKPEDFPPLASES
jgi:hypothetical protein